MSVTCARLGGKINQSHRYTAGQLGDAVRQCAQSMISRTELHNQVGNGVLVTRDAYRERFESWCSGQRVPSDETLCHEMSPECAQHPVSHQRVPNAVRPLAAQHCYRHTNRRHVLGRLGQRPKSAACQRCRSSTVSIVPARVALGLFRIHNCFTMQMIPALLRCEPLTINVLQRRQQCSTEAVRDQI